MGLDKPRARQFDDLRLGNLRIEGPVEVGQRLHDGNAGLFEAAGPVGQLVPALPAGYGFTAIIVAFLGRLHPVGILFAGLLMALTYIGGETAQISMSLPSATTAVFQGMFLFFLLATDVLVGYRPRWISKRVPTASTSPRNSPAPPIARPAAAQPGE